MSRGFEPRNTDDDDLSVSLSRKLRADAGRYVTRRIHRPLLPSGGNMGAGSSRQDSKIARAVADETPQLRKHTNYTLRADELRTRVHA